MTRNNRKENGAATAAKSQQANADAALALVLPVTLARFRRNVGISSVTAWRWRKKGWLVTENICGKPYVTPEQAQRFKERLAAGEFAQDHHATRRSGGAE